MTTEYKHAEWKELGGLKVIEVKHYEEDPESRYRNDWDNGHEFRDRLRLTLDGPKDAVLWLAADCCSTSYFANPEQAQDLVGRTIKKIEDRENKTEGDRDEDREVTIWHFLVFETDAGHVTLDWRNDSNGYYDGEPRLTFVEKRN